MNAPMGKQESLLAAVKANNFKEIKKFLNKHQLIFDKDFSDYKLLIEALRLGHINIAKLLLDSGCRVQCRKITHVYSTPLYYAVNLNCIELVKILLDKGISVKGKDANKETPLVFAMKNKFFDIVDLMLSNYKIKNLNINNEDEVIHFHIAVMRNNVKLVKTFLEHGMKVDQISKIKSNISEGYTPLHFAVEYQSVETVKLLLSNKANFGLKNSQGLTPLHLAFYLKNCKVNNEIIDLILSAHLKVMVNPIDNNGVSHFHIACCKSNLKLLKAFLKSGADCNNCIFSHSSKLPDYAPLHIAIKYNCEKTVQFLLDNKANINKTIGMGITPLHLAVESDDNTEIVKLLLQYNADVYATDIDKNTAIHNAFNIMQVKGINENRKAIINLLFSAHQGNLKNVSNKWGVTLFHIACATINDPQLIKNFLKQNVNINACVEKNVKWGGYTALDFAVMTSNLEVIEILLQKTVALKSTNFDNHSPLYLVCKTWFQDAMDAIAISTAGYPTKTLKDEDFKVGILNRFKLIDDNKYKIFKLYLKRKETHDFILFDVCEIIFNLLSKEVINPQNEMDQLKANQIIAIFKKIMITLIDDGYNINEKNNKKVSILHCLINHLRIYYSDSITEMIEMLLIRGAQVDSEAENSITPLMVAASNGFGKIVNILLKYKADPNKYSKTYKRPLHFALTSKQIYTPNYNDIFKVVDSLLAKGAEVDVRNNYNSTPLHHAAEFVSLHKCLLSLLRHNCKVDSKDEEGNTALHIACINRNLPGLITLLYYGADINLKNILDLTPLQVMFIPHPKMMLYENYEMLKILELHIIKLKCINFKVSQQNYQAFKEIKTILKLIDNPNFTREDFTTYDENVIFIDFCKRELSRMKNVKIDMYTSLYNIIFKNAHEVSKNINNTKFKELVDSRELKEKFSLYGYILNLQYKKGVKRYSLLKPATYVLQTILTGLPDLCYERILASFTDQELKTFIM